jgi:hypothetical protein
VAVPKSTTELGQACATVSVHLSTLRRCGMVTSWRSGLSVLHQRTPLATSLLASAITGDQKQLGRQDGGHLGPE